MPPRPFVRECVLRFDKFQRRASECIQTMYVDQGITMSSMSSGRQSTCCRRLSPFPAQAKSCDVKGVRGSQERREPNTREILSRIDVISRHLRFLRVFSPRRAVSYFGKYSNQNGTLVTPFVVRDFRREQP